MQSNFYIGEEIFVTTDLTSSPGNVYLISCDKNILYDSYNKIREIEKDLYKSLL